MTDPDDFRGGRPAPRPVVQRNAAQAQLPGIEQFAADRAARDQDSASLAASQAGIRQVCDDIKSMLLEKNRKYGNSALEPLGVFAKGDALSTIRVRIDDKLKRIKNGNEDVDEDTVLDLIGYLVLYKVGKKLAKDRE
jgi:hypothetical protein